MSNELEPSRFADQLVARAPDEPPTIASTLLRELQVSDKPLPVQRRAVQHWLNQGHNVSWLLSYSLQLFGLPTSQQKAS